MANGGTRRGNVVKLTPSASDWSGSGSEQQAGSQRAPDPAVLNLLIGDAAELAHEVERLGGPPQALMLAYIAEDVRRGDLASAAGRRDGIRRELRAITELQAKRRNDRIGGFIVMAIMAIAIIVPLLR